MTHDDWYQSLLQILTSSSSGGDLNSSIQAVLAEHPDPRVRVLAQYIANRMKREPEPEESPEDFVQAEPIEVDGTSRVRDSRFTKQRRGGRVRRIVRQMYSELDELQERNDVLSAALGACPICLGENPTCPACQGKGLPGFKDPDPELFNTLVAPAVRRYAAKGGADKEFMGSQLTE